MKRRQTPQKKQIINLFHKEHVLTAQEVIKKTGIESSTVYRNITRLVEDGVLKRVATGEGEDVYEKKEKETHHHFMCEGCKRIEAVAVSPRFITKSIPSSYVVTDIDVLIRGKCVDCAS